MSIPRITTGCERRMRRADSGIGYWRFISWIGRSRSADSMKSC
jgi:hypothetical protein